VSKVEKIVCAAIWIDIPGIFQNQPRNIDNGIVISGLRHANCIATYVHLTGKRLFGKRYIQGFITTFHRFVDREEALQIAITALQVTYPTISSKGLDSSDLY
jgi:hypothetical protein